MIFSSSDIFTFFLAAFGGAQVSKGQFRRALDQARLTAPSAGAPPSELLTEKEVEVLIKRYEVKHSNRKGGVGGGGGGGGCVSGDLAGGGEAEVNYWKLCQQIEKVINSSAAAQSCGWKYACC